MKERLYYSERVNGRRVAVLDKLPEATSRGLLNLIYTRIERDWFADEFPKQCPDGHGVAGTDRVALATSLQALHPEAPWPLWPSEDVSDEVVFDLLEYAAVRVAEPSAWRYHEYFGHHELRFDRTAGRAKFRADVTEMLRRGRTMFEQRSNGEVHRIGTPDVQAVLSRLDPATGDARLDELLNQARMMYTSHRSTERSVALERLWDAFERLKTVDLPAGDKKKSIELLLGHLDASWRPVIDAEMTTLTRLGNDYEIRHFETRALSLPYSATDYLFARLGALITELLSASDRLRSSDS